MSTEKRLAAWEAMSDRVRQVLEPDAQRLAYLRRVASKFFRANTPRGNLERRPAVKITIPIADPEIPADEARLVIRPSVWESRSAGQRVYQLDDDILLTLMCGTVKGQTLKLAERLTIRFYGPIHKPGTYTIGGGGVGPMIARCHPATVEVDAAVVCRAVMRFLDDPATMIAASGSHCVYCGRVLTDPESRSRGIGPECLDRMGDFLGWIALAPEGQPVG